VLLVRLYSVLAGSLFLSLVSLFEQNKYACMYVQCTYICFLAQHDYCHFSDTSTKKGKKRDSLLENCLLSKTT